MTDDRRKDDTNNADLMKDLPDDQLTDLQQTLSDSDSE